MRTILFFCIAVMCSLMLTIRSMEGNLPTLACNACMEADVDHQRNPVHIACRRGHSECLALLLAKEPEWFGEQTWINEQDEDGCTPLYLAADQGNATVAQVLVSAGAYCNVYDRAHWTPLHEAAYWGYTAVVKVLIDAGADVNVQDYHGVTPLYNALFLGHAEVARVLIAAGATLHASSGWYEWYLQQRAQLCDGE